MPITIQDTLGRADRELGTKLLIEFVKFQEEHKRLAQAYNDLSANMNDALRKIVENNYVPKADLTAKTAELEALKASVARKDEALRAQEKYSDHRSNCPACAKHGRECDNAIFLAEQAIAASKSAASTAPSHLDEIRAQALEEEAKNWDSGPSVGSSVVASCLRSRAAAIRDGKEKL